MIPAAASRLQSEQGIKDSAQLMAQDIQHKADGEVDPLILATVCAASGAAIDWLMGRHTIEMTLVEGFLYPGHSQPRMHAPPAKTGSALMDSLLTAVERAGIDLVTAAQVTDLYISGRDKIAGLRLRRPDGSSELLSCDVLILACSGYAGNPDLVRQYIPEIADAVYFGHAGNQGDAVLWGQALGAAGKHMTAYQGHGSVATPQGILITWALMMEGGIQVNVHGRRFSNEHQGYSEQALAVLSQTGGTAWNIYDQRLHELGMSFADYRDACNLGAVKSAPTVEALAQKLGLPPTALRQTMEDITDFAHSKKTDPLHRSFYSKPLMSAPWYGVKVTGALFHTQGGLAVDTDARVLRYDGSPLPNLLAAGGAACGLSGSKVSGYLSGNGLLSAVVLGRIAGQTAAAYCRRAGTKSL
jgi:fumarate reductase flavoprotein subunit